MHAGNPIRLVSAAVVVALAVVASFVTSTIVASRAYLKRGEQGHREGRTLDVTGSARVRIESDLALWNIRIAGEGETLEAAYVKLEASAVRVKEFLAKKEFPAETVTLGPIDTTRHFARDAKGNATREVTSYQLLRYVEIRTPDVRKVEAAAGEVTELLKTGAHVESMSPRFIYTKLQNLKLRVQGEATANARERGEKIAEKSGCRIGAVRDARAGILQITPPWSTEVTSMGINDTSSVRKDVRTTVHLTLMIVSR